VLFSRRIASNRFYLAPNRYLSNFIGLEFTVFDNRTGLLSFLRYYRVWASFFWDYGLANATADDVRDVLHVSEDDIPDVQELKMIKRA
jgi:hypothetical protein